MKLKDVKEVLDFLNENDMNAIKTAVMYMNDSCPNYIGLKGAEQCNEDDNCFECWGRCLALEENKDKLENVI